MKKVGILFVSVLALLGIFSLVTNNKLLAANNNERSSITLSPAVVEPSFNAGDHITKKLTVINDGNDDYTFVVYAGPFSVKDDNYDPDFVTVNKSTDAYQWIQFAKTTYTLKAGQSVEVPYTINVPKDAAPGGHYAVLFAETQPKIEKQSVARKKRVGTLVYMTVNGDIKLAGGVKSWSVPFWQRTTPLNSEVLIDNTGNTHFQSDINVTYKTLFGTVGYQYNGQSLVLPGTTRRTTFQWEHPPVFGLFKVSGTVKLLGKTEQLPQHYVLYTPKWLLYTLIVLIIVIVGYSALNKNKGKTNGKAKSTQKPTKEK